MTRPSRRLAPGTGPGEGLRSRCIVDALRGLGLTVDGLAAMSQSDVPPSPRQAVRTAIRGAVSEYPVSPALAELLRCWKRVRHVNRAEAPHTLRHTAATAVRLRPAPPGGKRNG